MRQPNRLPAGVAVLLTIVLAGAMVTGFLFVSGRSYLLQGLPGAPQPTPALVGTVQHSPAGTYWGAFLPGADQDQSVVTKFASTVGRQPAIVTMYEQWAGEPAFPAAAAQWMHAGLTAYWAAPWPWVCWSRDSAAPGFTFQQSLAQEPIAVPRTGTVTHHRRHVHVRAATPE